MLAGFRNIAENEDQTYVSETMVGPEANPLIPIITQYSSDSGNLPLEVRRWIIENLPAEKIMQGPFFLKLIDSLQDVVQLMDSKTVTLSIECEIMLRAFLEMLRPLTTDQISTLLNLNERS